MEFKNLDDVKKFIEKLTYKYREDINKPYQIRYSNRMRRTLGRCTEMRFVGRPVRFVFTYNIKYLTEYLNNSKVIENTVLHEIAHAIVGAKHHHDSVWRIQHIKMGGNGQRLFVKEATC